MDTENDTPKKYIRTFAGDIDIVKTGGIPNLVPLSEIKKDTPSPTERLVAPSPISPTSPMSPPANVFIPKIEPPSAEQSIQPPKPEIPIAIKTYEGDFSDKIKEAHASPATVLAAEQDAGPKIYQEAPAPQDKNSLYMICGGGALVLLSIIGVYFAYQHYSSSLATMVLAPTISAPIFVDDRQEISGDGTALLRGVEQSVTHSLAVGGVRLLYTESATSTSNDIFSAMFQNQASDILLRNLNTKNSMTGVVNVGGKQSPFFILSVTSYNDTFAGMLSWEPMMPRDLNLLFPPYPEPTLTTSSTLSKTLKKTGFYDEVVNNHDAREYRDAESRTILLYGYWNQTTLVIARDEAAFSEILRRLGIAQAQ